VSSGRFTRYVKSVFLNGDVPEEIYMEQPPGYVKDGTSKPFRELKKYLYGLKQAPRAWYEKIVKFSL
jgi:hypothetical protein